MASPTSKAPSTRPAFRTRPGQFSIDRSTQELQRLQTDLNRVVKKVTSSTDLIERLARFGRNRIQNRTFRGLDLQDRPFRPYSPIWAAVRKRKGLPTSRVTLRFRGTMYAAIQREIKSPVHARLSVRPWVGGGNPTPRDEVAESHQKGDRKWFGFSPSDKDALNKEAQALLVDVLLESITDARPLGDDISVRRNRPSKQLDTIEDERTADYHDLYQGL